MSIKCPKCGFENPPNAKFCANCGSRLSVAAATRRFEGLALLHIAGSIYLLVSLATNTLVRASVLFAAPYAASGLLGLYAGYMLYTGRVGRHLKFASALAIAIGLAATSLLFLVGLGIKGVIGPAWVIFLVSAWLLWRERANL